MNKMLIYIITVILIVFIGTICLAFADYDDKRNTEFLKEYGWETSEKFTEAVKIKIPKVFDDVYTNYNALQKIAGLDLKDYKGKDAVRYTYIVKNFPKDIDQTVYANVICVNKKPIAGDIMTVQSDGFMYSLNYLKTGE